MNQTPPKVVYLVIIAMSILAFIGVSSLCLTLFFRNYADPAVLSAIISITGGLVGSLGTVLVSTKTQLLGETTTTTTSTSPSPQKLPDKPTEVLVTNKPDDPVPTIEKTE